MHDLVLRELRQLRAELADMRAAITRLAPRALTPPQCTVVERLHALFGTNPFTSVEVLGATRLDLRDYRALRDALQDVIGAPDLDSQGIGLVLRSIDAVGGTTGVLRLVAGKKERGSRVWFVVEGG